jgi:uncharacterized membrane-anchored protein YitT (DUF2179 family)
MTLGIVLTAYGLDAFLIPNKLAAGGVSGLATIVYYLGLARGIALPVGIQMLVYNAVLLVFAWKLRGSRYLAKTIYGAVGLSVAIDLLGPLTKPLATDDLLLAALFGGAATGIGLGMVFKAGGNTGGTDIVAQLLSKRVPLGQGQLMLLADAVVTITAAIVFGPKYALYAAVAIVVSGAAIDLVLEGVSVNKAAFIISDRSVELGEAINNELKRGATALSATGVYTGQARGMLWVVLSRNELDDLKKLVVAVDPDAFMVVSDVHEAIGEGFKEMRA